MLKYALTFFIFSIFGLPPAFAQTVTDGDSIKRADGVRLRLYGIDTPERNQPYGKEATRVLKQYMPLVAKMTTGTSRCNFKNNNLMAAILN